MLNQYPKHQGETKLVQTSRKKIVPLRIKTDEACECSKLGFDIAMQ